VNIWRAKGLDSREVYDAAIAIPHPYIETLTAGLHPEYLAINASLFRSKEGWPYRNT
jgi:hypothetical protein